MKREKREVINYEHRRYQAMEEEVGKGRDGENGESGRKVTNNVTTP